MSPSSSVARGMSLTELLVVICILGLLAVTVIPAINANSEARRNRVAAAAVVGFINQAQSKSIGRQTWSGFRALPITAGSDALDRLVFVDYPAPYRGDTATASVRVTAVSGGYASGSTAPGTFDSLPKYLDGAEPNTLTIRLGGSGPVYRLVSGATTSPLTFALQSGASGENLGQTATATPWPAIGTSYGVEIFRSAAPAGMPLVIPENRVIDIRWSGFGNTAPAMSASGARQLAAGRSITVSFDNSGSLRQFSYTTGAGPVTETANGLLFLLVGRADRAGNDPQDLDPTDDSRGANWQYADSAWVAIDPATGLATSAPCDPNPSVNASCIDSTGAIRTKLKAAPTPRQKQSGNN